MVVIINFYSFLFWIRYYFGLIMFLIVLRMVIIIVIIDRIYCFFGMCEVLSIFLEYVVFYIFFLKKFVKLEFYYFQFRDDEVEDETLMELFVLEVNVVYVLSRNMCCLLIDVSQLQEFICKLCLLRCYFFSIISEIVFLCNCVNYFYLFWKRVYGFNYLF